MVSARLKNLKNKHHGKNRCTKKTPSLLADHCQEMILALYQEGGSDKEVKVLIHLWLGKFSNNLWDRWLNEEEDFSETVKKGRIFSEAWWEMKGITI